MKFKVCVGAAALGAWVVLAGCAGLQLPVQSSVPAAQNIRTVAPQQAQRLYNIMVPLLSSMNRPLAPHQVHVGIMDDASINAANAGGGNFYVTTGLLEQANESQLRGIMAHELAHDDLGHVAQMQALGSGLSLGARLLEEYAPGASAIVPLAGTLIVNGYSRKEEYAADAHAVQILGRAGYPKETMIDALSWVAQSSGGPSSGGFLATHPGTGERIDALR